MRWDDSHSTDLRALWTNQIKGAIKVIIYDIQHQVFWMHLICLYGAFASSLLLRCSFGLRLAAAAGLRESSFSFDENLTTPPLTFSFALWRHVCASRVKCSFAQKYHFVQTVYHTTCLTFFFLHKGDKQMNVKSPLPSPHHQVKSSSSRRTLKVRLLICPFWMKKPQRIQTR